MIGKAQKHSRFSDIYGLVHGIEAGLKEEFVSLNSISNLKELSQTPAAALGSSRYKVRDEDYARLIEVFRTGLIARSLSASVSEPDYKIASFVGSETVKQLMQGMSDCMISLQSFGTKPIPLQDISGKTRHFPHDYLDASQKMISPAFRDYALPYLGEVAAIARLKAKRIAKRLPY